MGRASLLATLLFASAAGSLAWAASAQWYFSKMAHDDDAPPSGEHAHHHHRSWEPEHEIDPAKIKGHQEMYEVTRFPNVERPTPEQQRRADDLVQRCLASAKRHGWFDFKKATKDGFRLMHGDDIHYANEPFVLDRALLDPDRPEFLLYYNTKAGRRLAGFMFLTRKPEERGPQVGGPLTVWHYHAWSKSKCLLHKLLIVGAPDSDGHCRVGEPAWRSPEMMHVWFVDHPQGPFATHMGLTDEVRAQLERPDWP